ncbi:MAG TPA: hypothetical protein VL172_04790, partial [Kofleriaceae bacterium]|nr:hypothetical protein [Kofleriaceae bacterium]
MGGGTLTTPQVKQVTPPAPGKAAPTPAAPPSNLNAGQQATLARALPHITSEWKTICGVLLSDIEPLLEAPGIETFKTDCYNFLAKPNTTAQAGLMEVYDVLSMTDSRKRHFLALEEMERAARVDQDDRAQIHKLLVDLSEGGQLQYCTDRILAHYANLTSWGRAWWKSEDAKPWINAYAAYINNATAVSTHATYGLALEQQLPAVAQRTRALISIMNLLTLGNLAGKVETAPQAEVVQPVDKAKQDEWKAKAKELKDKIEPFLPAAKGGKPPELSMKEWDQYDKVVKELNQTPIEVRDLINQDAEFMRRVALLGDMRESWGNTNAPMTLMGALDTTEALVDKIIGWKIDERGVKQPPRPPNTEPQQFEILRGYLVSHPGEENRELRLKLMTHSSIAEVIRYFADEHKRELWRLATRGDAKKMAEDALFEAVKAGDTAGAARALLGMGADDRARIQQLQDDPIFRSSINSDAMKKTVDVDGIMVKPYDMVLLMWGRRPGDTSDPGLTAGTEENIQLNQDPLKVDELRLLDTKIYDPVIKGLKTNIDYNDG